jgi:hypothetical protein
METSALKESNIDEVVRKMAANIIKTKDTTVIVNLDIHSVQSHQSDHK